MLTVHITLTGLFLALAAIFHRGKGGSGGRRNGSSAIGRGGCAWRWL